MATIEIHVLQEYQNIHCSDRVGEGKLSQERGRGGRRRNQYGGARIRKNMLLSREQCTPDTHSLLDTSQ